MWRSNVYGQSFLWLPRMGRISFALNNCVEVCGSNQLVSPLLLGTVAHELLWLVLVTIKESLTTRLCSLAAQVEW